MRVRGTVGGVRARVGIMFGAMVRVGVRIKGRVRICLSPNPNPNQVGHLEHHRQHNEEILTVVVSK